MKVNYYSQNNKAGKLLASQLWQRQIKNKIHKLAHHIFGKVVINPQETADTFAQYYESLYNLKDESNTPQPNLDNITKFLDNIKLPNIDPIDLEQLNKPISPEETLKVIKELPKNKTQGADGLSGEYYMAFKETLVPYLTCLTSS